LHEKPEVALPWLQIIHHRTTAPPSTATTSFTHRAAINIILRKLQHKSHLRFYLVPFAYFRQLNMSEIKIFGIGLTRGFTTGNISYKGKSFS